MRSFVRLVLALILAISPWPDLPRLISEWRPPDPSVQVDPGQCLRDLAALPLAANPVPDRRTAEGCGWTNAVRVTDGAVTLDGGFTASCALARSFAEWLDWTVQRAALSQFGEMVTGVDHFGTYACRPVRTSAGRGSRPSQHASANAIDVSGFVLSDGRRVTVRRNWDDPGPGGRFLREVAVEACSRFRVVLTPDYDAFHADHFHLDMGGGRLCR